MKDWFPILPDTLEYEASSENKVWEQVKEPAETKSDLNAHR